MATARSSSGFGFRQPVRSCFFDELADDPIAEVSRDESELADSNAEMSTEIDSIANVSTDKAASDLDSACVDNSWFENDFAASIDVESVESDDEEDETSTETPVETPVATSVETPAETLIDDETPVETSTDDETDPPRVRSNQVNYMDLPAKVTKIGCRDKRLRRKVRKSARKMIVALIKHNAYRCPMNKYTRHKLKP